MITWLIDNMLNYNTIFDSFKSSIFNGNFLKYQLSLFKKINRYTKE